MYEVEIYERDRLSLARRRRPAFGHSRLRARREAQLIDAALECVAALGLRETTVHDVAARAGMAVGSISQYFESKEQLLTAALRTLSEEFEATWQRGLAAAGQDPARRLACFVGAYFDPSVCQRRKIAVWFAFWGEVKARPQYRAVCERYDRLHDEVLEGLCAALCAAGDGRDLAPRAIAKIVASICHGLWLELLTGTDGLGRPELGALAVAALDAHFPRHAGQFAAPAGPESGDAGR